ncbi:hypothetical protein FQZ97_956290 [compost metagenome]
MRARNGQVTTVKTPCTPKYSLIFMASTSSGHAMKASAKNSIAPTTTLNTSSALKAAGERWPMMRNRKSLRVMRPEQTAAASCRKTMEATERAANSATPVMGASKKLRPRTSATINSIMRKIHAVPTAASKLATPCRGLARPATAGVSLAKSGSLCTGHL